jgi:uncharacterized protein YsxB (DUF464 family)
MTHIRRSIRDRHYKIEIDGHADSAEYGKDLVCCAISTLTFTLLAYLEKAADEGRILNFTTHIREKNGYICLECDLIHNNVEEGITAIEQGYEIIEENYKKYIKFS